MEYQRLFNTLNDYKVKYLICGGLAVNIYGIPRMTADIDILLDFEEQNIVNFENAVKVLLYKQIIPLKLNTFIKKEDRQKVIEEKNLIAYSFYSSTQGFVNLDVLLDVPIEFEVLWEKKVIKHLNGVDLFLVSVEDLIVLKNYANRIQDKSDVLLLSKLIK